MSRETPPRALFHSMPAAPRGRRPQSTASIGARRVRVTRGDRPSSRRDLAMTVKDKDIDLQRVLHIYTVEDALRRRRRRRCRVAHRSCRGSGPGRIVRRRHDAPRRARAVRPQAGQSAAAGELVPRGPRVELRVSLLPPARRRSQLPGPSLGARSCRLRDIGRLVERGPRWRSGRTTAPTAVTRTATRRTSTPNSSAHGSRSGANLFARARQIPDSCRPQDVGGRASSDRHLPRVLAGVRWRVATLPPPPARGSRP